MVIADFLGIAVVGSAASLFIEFLKKRYGDYAFKSRIAVLVASVILGAGYWFIRDTQLLNSIIGVLVSTSTFYAFFINKKVI